MEDRDKEGIGSVLVEMLDPKKIPQDLVLLLIWLIIAIFTIYIPIINETFIRVIFAIPVLLFIPGYAFIAALFPNKYQKVDECDDTKEKNKKQLKKAKVGIPGIERFALSIGLSICIIPLIGFVLNYTSFGIRLAPILISISIFTSIMVIVALFRRAKLSEDDRFSVHFEQIPSVIKKEMFPRKQSKFDKFLSVLIIGAILVAIGVAIFVIAFPLDGEKYTEFYILGKDKLAGDYPDRFYAGIPQSIWIGINNHESRDINYTVDTILLKTEWNNTINLPVIHASKPLDRFTISVADESTVLEQYNFTISDTEYNRLEFLLYNETVPPITTPVEEKINESYRDLHLWIDIV